MRTSPTPDRRLRSGGIAKRIAQPAMTGIVAVDLVPAPAHRESRDLDRGSENLPTDMPENSPDWRSWEIASPGRVNQVPQ